MKRVALILTGCVALLLGAVGAVLPLLPATPFVLIAAGCFAGAWPTMHARMAASRIYGPMLRAEPAERYLPLGTKICAIAFTWLSIGATLALIATPTWIQVLLGVITLGVTGFLLWMPSAPRTKA